jgi:hypothetical protein
MAYTYRPVSSYLLFRPIAGVFHVGRTIGVRTRSSCTMPIASTRALFHAVTPRIISAATHAILNWQRNRYPGAAKIANVGQKRFAPGRAGSSRRRQNRFHAHDPYLSRGAAGRFSPFHWCGSGRMARLHLRRDGDPLHHASTRATRIDPALYFARCHDLKFTAAIAGFTLPPLSLLKSHENSPRCGRFSALGARYWAIF